MSGPPARGPGAAGEAQRAAALRGRAAQRPTARSLFDDVLRRIAQLDPPAVAAAAATRLRALEGELRRATGLASLGTLLSEAVHEIRNPLVSIKTFLELLPQRQGDPEFMGSYRQIVSEELARLERLLDDLLRHAHSTPDAAHATAPGRASVDEAIGSVAGLLRYRALEREIELRSEVEPRLPRVDLQDDALRQVLLNLALNALDASPSGARVTLRAAARGSGVELRVEDQGAGIDPRDRDQLFEPFFSGRSGRPGGLGLAITRRLVEEAGGSVSAERLPGGGARLRVRLPAALADSARATPARSDRARAGRS